LATSPTSSPTITLLRQLQSTSAPALHRRRLALTDWFTPTGSHRLALADWFTPTGSRRLALADWFTPTGSRRLALADWPTPTGSFRLPHVSRLFPLFQEPIADSPRPIAKPLRALPQARAESTTRSGTTDGDAPKGAHHPAHSPVEKSAGQPQSAGDWVMRPSD
jgi:hypothetical protein